MTSPIEELSPSYLGEDRIDFTTIRSGVASANCKNVDGKGNVILTAAPGQNMGPFQAFAPISLAIDYSRCNPEGVSLPLELIIQGPSKMVTRRHFVKGRPPSIVQFTPHEGGVHLVRIAEMSHNGWFGAVKFIVAGESLGK